LTDFCFMVETSYLRDVVDRLFHKVIVCYKKITVLEFSL